MAPLVEANTRFAFKFFHKAVEKSADDNVLTSPTSLALDFALLQNAADPGARDEIVSVFEWRNMSADDINQQSLALRKVLSYEPPPHPRSEYRRKGSQPPPMCCELPPEHLTLAGSLWLQPGVGFRSAFLDINRKFYFFDTTRVANKGSDATTAVNNWISKHTNGLLNAALDSWKKDDFLVVDATWFKGAWTMPFSVDRTHTADFTLRSGDKKKIPLMVQDRHFSYLRGPNFQAVQLFYYHASMYVFLPNENSSLGEFEQSLTPENWATWARDFGSKDGHLELPRFSAKYRGDAAAALDALGIRRAFTTFSSFAPLVTNSEGAALTRTLQIVSLTVDEKGTEVASAGVVGGVPGGISSEPPPPPFRMIVDRPFFFAICDNRTGAILYMGAIVDPLALSSTQR